MTVISYDDVVTVATSIGNRNAGVSHTIEADDSFRYTYPDGSHCFIGEVLEGLGAPLPPTGTSINSAGVPMLVSWLGRQGVTVQGSAQGLLTRLQVTADKGFYWNDVVSKTV